MAQPHSPNFYLGRLFDPAQGKSLDTPLLYDPSNLTTHAVVTGMTGSGKTGLCIAMLEEAALQGVPSIIVDPKGDLTNLLLHFPTLAGPDFEPWIDPDLAARQGKPLPVLAEETAARWKDGLAGWNLGPADLTALQDRGRYTIFTPGSSAGVPVNVLNSFQAPGIPWEENRELLREKIASTVTALLGLIGMGEIDPLRSHIFLSNIFENAWSKQQPFDLTGLIMQTQTPPFQRLGAFPIDTFFPASDRSDLAMLLNNFLAAPSFQSWQEGQPLDVPSLLFTPEGKPRQSIFYLAHLNESERMFFTTLLFSAVETWMRTQRGTSGLRALLYFDEILGYLPPTRNPPSKQVLLRMLKQARAFGVGLLLATQNPVDLDYKALSNAGSWFIGRLQTDQDKQRLLDGLNSASGGANLPELNRMISGLQKRVFLLHSINAPVPQLFQSRWTLNFLAGPLTRSQIPALNRLAGVGLLPVPAVPLSAPLAAAPAAVVPQNLPLAAEKPAPAAATIPIRTAAVTPAPQVTPPPAPSAVSGSEYLPIHPALPAGITEYFMPLELGPGQAAAAANISLAPTVRPEIIYRPVLLAQASLRYFAARYKLDSQRQVAVQVDQLEGSLVRWEDHTWGVYQASQLQNQPLSRARFVPLPGWMADARRLGTLQRDFLDWAYRTGTIRLRANQTLKLFASPNASQAEFREQCSEAARAQNQAEADQIRASFEKKLSLVNQKISRLQAEERKQKEEADRRRMEEIGANTDLFLSLFSKRKKSLNTSLTKGRLAGQAKADLDEVRRELEDLHRQAAEIEKERITQLTEAQERWAAAVNDFSEIPIAPLKKDIFLDLFGIAWRPYYLVSIGTETQEIPAFPYQR